MSKKSDFYKQLKEKTSVLANIFGILSILITSIAFIYSKFFAAEDLVASYYWVNAPKKSFNEMIKEKSNVSDTVAFENCFFITHIHLHNRSNKRFKNIEIPLMNFFSDRTNINKGYYFINDSLTYFTNKEYLKISNISPYQLSEVTIYSQTLGINDNSFVITENTNFKIRPTIEIETENNFDAWISRFVVENKFIQILIYVFSLIGFYFFIKNILPYLINLIPNKRK